MPTTKQHIQRGLLLTLILAAMLLAMAGYADVVIDGLGMGVVTDANRTYLTDAFDRSLVGFLVLSGIKSGLAIIEGSEVGIGFNLEIGDSLLLGSDAFVVSTILHPTGGPEDGIIMGDLHRFQNVLGKPGRVCMVEISAFCRGCPITEITLQIAGKFPNAKVTALKQAVMSKMQSIEMIKSFSYGVAVLVIFIGSLLVFVTMMGSVNERTREIGIFRAIGFRQGHIMQIILLEAIVVGLIGGFLGYLIGNGIAWLAIPFIIQESTLSNLDLTLGGVSLILSVALSLLASLYPAVKASRMDPSSALRAL